MNPDNIHIVVGLDFGTTYSGFAYSHVNNNNNNIYTNSVWDGEVRFKINTALQYDENNNVKDWGDIRSKKKKRKAKEQNRYKDVEMFKLHLADLPNELKPILPDGIDYKKAITDYLREIGKVIKETVVDHWPKVDYFENVLLVLTVPAEYSERSKAIMRTCAFNAGLIKEECSINLQFTTEPEAAAVYCMKNNLGEQNLMTPGINFMVVDCGGGTVDLTTRKLINNNQLGEITERAGDFCGSTFVDDEFFKYLRKQLGIERGSSMTEEEIGRWKEGVARLREDFCENAKFTFTGKDPTFSYVLDINEIISTLKRYVTDENVRKTLNENEWTIEIDFETMKSIFEPVIQKIFLSIKVQLDNAKETCSAMFLVGGFSESKYLQERIKKEFSHRISNISVPPQPVIAVVCGAVLYGLSIRSNLNNLGNDNNMECVIASRVLKYTYGVKIYPKWKEGDPPDKRTDDGHILNKFDCLARRGEIMNIGQEVTSSYVPVYPDQTKATHYIYYTQERDAKYCDEPGMKLLGTLRIDLPGSGLDRPVLFGLTFGKMEITATSRNQITGQSYLNTFEINLD